MCRRSLHDLSRRRVGRIRFRVRREKGPSQRHLWSIQFSFRQALHEIQRANGGKTTVCQHYFKQYDGSASRVDLPSADKLALCLL